MRKIKIFDTTLRDGEQAPGCSMHMSEKMEIALALERLGVDVIEAGFAVASQGDFEAIEKIAQTVRNSTICSLSRAVAKDIDLAYQAVRKAESPRIHTFLATSPVHMQYKLKMTPERVLEIIDAMVRHACKYLSDVEFSAEDAMRSDKAFLARAVETAIKAGATTINIPDTVGYVTPVEITEMFSYLQEHVSGIENVCLAVHCHNDLGLAVANSLAAIMAGAGQVECTLNGLGERAGNAAMEEIVMGLHTRRDFYNCETRIDTTRFYRTSKMVYNILGLPHPINKAVVGTNAFAHESGIHQHGMLANRETYEIMTPESVGLVKNDMVFGKHSGRHAVEQKLRDLGFELNQEELDAVFQRFKDLADKKKKISVHDLEALMTRQQMENSGEFKLQNFTVYCSNRAVSHATVSLCRGSETQQAEASGDGPIDAAFNAIDKIAGGDEHSLEDYSIFSITEGNDAQAEAVVKLRSGDRLVTGRGISTDVVEASILAYINGLNRLT